MLEFLDVYEKEVRENIEPSVNVEEMFTVTRNEEKEKPAFDENEFIEKVKNAILAELSDKDKKDEPEEEGGVD